MKLTLPAIENRTALTTGVSLLALAFLAMGVYALRGETDMPSTLSATLHAGNLMQNTLQRKVDIMAWLYPGEPGCDAVKEYKDGRHIDILKPEYYRVEEGGALAFLSEDTAGCNGYSTANVADLKKYSKAQYVTVASAYAPDMELFLKNALADGEDIATLVSFTVDNNFEGVEIDFEDFGGWTPEQYDLYKQFVTRLGDALHAEDKKLMLVGPATANAEQEAWFAWRYDDFVKLPVNMIIVMTYDYQFDQGAGTPVAPFEWVEDSIEWALARFPDKSRLGVGIPSYGYRGVSGTQELRVQTNKEITSEIGTVKGERDAASGELVVSRGGVQYFYQDSTSMDQKYTRALQHGVAAVSVWSLGGNPWFSK